MIKDMSVEDGLTYTKLLLEKNQEQFDKYLVDWQRKQDVAKSISSALYQDEAETLAQTVATKFDVVEESFFGVGGNSAIQFENGFLAQLQSIVSKIQSTITSAFGTAVANVGNIPVQIATGVNTSVPQLAKGGVLKKGQVGLLEGDGAEAVVPLEQNTGWINELARRINNVDRRPAVTGAEVALGEKLDRIYDRLSRLQIVLDSDTLVGQTIDKIDAMLGDKQLLSERGV